MEDPIVVAHSCQKTKQLICAGMERKTVVAYCSLYFPAHYNSTLKIFVFIKYELGKHAF